MEFIQLTSSISGDTVLVNVSRILSVIKDVNGSHICISGSERIAVSEPQDYIKQHLSVCNKSYNGD